MDISIVFNKTALSLGVIMLFSFIGLAQEKETIKEEILVFEEEVSVEKPEETYPKFKVGGVFQARYLSNFKHNVDINGLQHENGEGVVSNTFDIKRMRVFMNAKITENLEVVTLVNFADFKSDPKTRVLENAYAKYTVNRYLQITVGQFRPLFGREETYAVDIVKSIDYSNSYYLFGSNGWMSFQIGAAITGSVDLGNIPMSYGLSVTNGNGKNTTDNNDEKNYSSRLLFNIDKAHKFNVGVSGGLSKIDEKTIYAAGAEAAAEFKLDDRWSVDFQLEAKQGINQTLYNSLPIDARTDNVDDYKMKSFYVLPNIRYELGKKHFQAIEFACRYEYLDDNASLNSNPRQTWVPMLSLEFLKNYAARIQIGMQIDNYKKNIENTKIYNSNLAFVQFQCRF